MKARVSNANQRATAGDRKAVFKSVLDNPFKVQWPFVPHNVQKTVLASLVTILADVGIYQLERKSTNKRRKRLSRDKERKEKAKRLKVGNEEEAMTVDDNDVGTTTQTTHEDGNAVIEVDAEPDIRLPLAPPVFAHLTIGINEVTKRLESQAQSRRLRASIYASTCTSDSVEASQSTSKSAEPERASLAYVFVCRADIDLPLLIAHLPELVASCNAPIPCHKSPPVHLITLPKQAVSTLAEAVGLRRVSVLALDAATPSLATLFSLLADIQPPSAAWLTGPAPRPAASHIPTHIKQLRTTAPRDMRANKQARTEGRRAAKERHKLNFQTKNKNKNKEANKDVLVKAMTTVKVKVKPSKKRIKVVSSTAAVTQDLLPT